MDDSDFEHLMNAAREAREHVQGATNRGVRVHHPEGEANVRALRERLDLSQAHLARLIGVSDRTIRAWEQGDLTPRGPARVLLRVLDRHPVSVLTLARSTQALPDGDRSLASTGILDGQPRLRGTRLTGQ